MDLRRIRAFAAVADTLHFGRAAEQLHLAQPALTQQIQTLERELDVRLLDRDRRSVRLTAVGTLFLVEARKVLEQVERATLVAARARRGEIGCIEVGHVGSVAYSGVLSRAVLAFQRAVPGGVLHLRERDLQPQLADVAEGRLDVAFVRLPAGSLPDSLRIVTLHNESVMACLRFDHPAAGAPIALATLCDEPFLATHLRQGLGFYDTMFTLCAEAGFTLRVVHRSAQFSTIVSLVAAGKGVALVPESVSLLALSDIVYRPLLGIDRRSGIALVHRTEEDSPVVLRFIQLSDEMARGGAFELRSLGPAAPLSAL